jgi:hypothetical protein
VRIMLANWQKTVAAAVIGAKLLSPGMARAQTWPPGGVPTPTVTGAWDEYAAALRDWHDKRQVVASMIVQMRSAAGLRTGGMDEKSALGLMMANPYTTSEEKKMLTMIVHGAYHNWSAKKGWDKANQNYLDRVKIVDEIVGPPPIPPKS